ncbi:MAG TPA: gamma-glutamyl-gamma-aminobutyrate hydrolase family protein [Actinomycetota bacterium]|nr:gamma-glutamyl-gamma-aminobutyrate hydrolase family protein [Actinomycetota bacterium]
MSATIGAAPEIAVVAYHLRPGRVSLWQVGGYGVPENYVDAVRRAGGLASLVLPGDPRPLAELLDRFGGLLLVGGGDVEPWRFGAEPHERLYGLEPDRDAFEIDLLREADSRGLPALCICRGMQVMNVAFGGSLIQHLPDDPRYQPHGTPSGADGLSHDVRVAAGSRLAETTGASVLACSSHPHQGIDRVGDGLVVTARSEDDLPEAIEREGEGWILGVQWHPEDTATEDPGQQRLFDSLVERSR